MSGKRIFTAAFICIALGFAGSAYAQWQEDEEPERLEDQERQEVLFRGSTVEQHDQGISLPRRKKKEKPPEKVPPPGTYKTPAEEVQGTSVE